MISCITPAKQRNTFGSYFTNNNLFTVRPTSPLPLPKKLYIEKSKGTEQDYSIWNRVVSRSSLLRSLAANLWKFKPSYQKRADYWSLMPFAVSRSLRVLEFRIRMFESTSHFANVNENNMEQFFESFLNVITQNIILYIVCEIGT